MYCCFCTGTDQLVLKSGCVWDLWTYSHHCGHCLRSDLSVKHRCDLLVSVSIFYLFWWYGVFYAITMYLLFLIVTDHRIIDSEQHGFSAGASPSCIFQNTGHFRGHFRSHPTFYSATLRCKPPPRGKAFLQTNPASNHVKTSSRKHRYNYKNPSGRHRNSRSYHYPTRESR